MPTEKIALGVFLAVVGALFALFASAYFMRMEFVGLAHDAASADRLAEHRHAGARAALRCNARSSPRGRVTAARSGSALATGGLATLGLLAGQLVAWRDLAAGGYLLAGNPANSFFYLLTGLHGLHILGGLVALARADARRPGAWRARCGATLRLRLELCATYWHFLLFVWLGLLVLFSGWAAELHRHLPPDS